MFQISRLILVSVRILQISLTNTPAPSEPLCSSPAHHGQKTGRIPRVQITHEASFDGWTCYVFFFLLKRSGRAGHLYIHVILISICVLTVSICLCFTLAYHGGVFPLIVIQILLVFHNWTLWRPAKSSKKNIKQKPPERLHCAVWVSWHHCALHPGNTRGFLSAKYLPAPPKLPPQLKKQHSWVVAGRFEPVKTLRFSNFVGTSLPSVEGCMFVWGELWKMIVRLLFHLFFSDFSIHSYIFPSLFLRPLLIMKPWRSEGFSMSPRLLQGYVLKTRLLNENPTALGWEMFWVRGTRAGHSEFRR